MFANAPYTFEPPDSATAELVRQLYEEDLAREQALSLAEQIQLSKALYDTSNFARVPGLPQDRPVEVLEESSELVAARARLEGVNFDLSVRMKGEETAAHLKVVGDRNIALALAHSFDATKRKELLDFEFARSLQATDAQGQRDIDAPQGMDIDSLLGRERVAQLMAARQQTPRHNAESDDMDVEIIEPHSKGKGKATAATTAMDPRRTPPNCGICLEPCRPTGDPFAASTSASRLQDGIPYAFIVGPIAHRHVYCIECLSRYIATKLADSTGKMFPCTCPECDFELTDAIAAKVFGARGLESWHYRKLLDDTPALYCPNKTCSVRIIPSGDGNPQATCPSCQKMICSPCQSLWHQGRTCAQYQALPPGERDPDDFKLLELAGSKGWKRCYACAAVTELVQGCYHITCPCSAEWCYICGKAWDLVAKRCSSNPTCALWDERNLMNDGDVPAARPALQPAPVVGFAIGARFVNPPAAPIRYDPPQQYAQYQQLQYQPPPQQQQQQQQQRADPMALVARILSQGGGVRHGFTAEFVVDGTCGYCREQFNGAYNLQHHLRFAQHHYHLCCDKFFVSAQAMDQHMRDTRGDHQYFSSED